MNFLISLHSRRTNWPWGSKWKVIHWKWSSRLDVFCHYDRESRYNFVRSSLFFSWNLMIRVSGICRFHIRNSLFLSFKFNDIFKHTKGKPVKMKRINHWIPRKFSVFLSSLARFNNNIGIFWWVKFCVTPVQFSLKPKNETVFQRKNKKKRLFQNE